MNFQNIGYGTMGYMSGGEFHPMGTGNWYLGGYTGTRYRLPEKK